MVTGRLRPGCWLTGILRQKTHFHPSGLPVGVILLWVGVFPPTGIPKSSSTVRSTVGIPKSSTEWPVGVPAQPLSWLVPGGPVPVPITWLPLPACLVQSRVFYTLGPVVQPGSCPAAAGGWPKAAAAASAQTVGGRTAPGPAPLPNKPPLASPWPRDVRGYAVQRGEGSPRIQACQAAAAGPTVQQQQQQQHQQRQWAVLREA
jgi:hypothetical protein